MRNKRSPAHPNCWDDEAGEYNHVDCVKPSGEECISGCGRPAGTKWGPLWCPPCDVKRLNRINASIKEILTDLDKIRYPQKDKEE